MGPIDSFEATLRQPRGRGAAEPGPRADFAESGGQVAGAAAQLINGGLDVLPHAGGLRLVAPGLPRVASVP